MLVWLASLGKTLRMRGGLGPLQEMGIDGVLRAQSEPLSLYVGGGQPKP